MLESLQRLLLFAVVGQIRDGFVQRGDPADAVSLLALHCSCTRIIQTEKNNNILNVCVLNPVYFSMTETLCVAD